MKYIEPLNNLFSFVFQGRIDVPVVVACFETFSKTLSKPTWVILDNAAQLTLFQSTYKYLGTARIIY